MRATITTSACGHNMEAIRSCLIAQLDDLGVEDPSYAVDNAAIRIEPCQRTLWRATLRVEVDQ